MTRTGKIARLPRALREELNRRLQNGATGRAAVEWLNERPDVREVMAQHFGGNPVNEQNVTEWRQGGYAEWLSRQDLLEQVRDAAGEAEDLTQAGGSLADHAARLLAARFLILLAGWDGDPAHPAVEKLRALSTYSRELIALRRGDHSAARLRMEQARFDKARADEAETDSFELKQELGTAFQRWLQQPDIKKLLENGRTTDAERIAAIQRRVFGHLAVMLETPDERRATIASRAIHGDGI